MSGRAKRPTLPHEPPAAPNAGLEAYASGDDYRSMLHICLSASRGSQRCPRVFPNSPQGNRHTLIAPPLTEGVNALRWQWGRFRNNGLLVIDSLKWTFAHVVFEVAKTENRSPTLNLQYFKTF